MDNIYTAAEAALILGITEEAASQLPTEMLCQLVAGHYAAAAYEAQPAPRADIRAAEERAARWSAAARGYWAAADQFRRRRAWREMRQAADAASAAEAHSGHGGKLLAAIFGGGAANIPALGREDAEAARCGDSVSPAAAAAYRAAVDEEIRAHKRRAEARRRAEFEAARVAREAAASARRAAEAEVAAARREANSALIGREGFAGPVSFRNRTCEVRIDNLTVTVRVAGQAADEHVVRITAVTDGGELIGVSRPLTDVERAERAAERAKARAERLRPLIEATAATIAAAYAAVAAKIGGVVVTTPTADEIASAASSAVLGEVLAEDGQVFGIRAADLVSAAEMPRARADWPAYLAAGARPTQL